MLPCLCRDLLSVGAVRQSVLQFLVSLLVEFLSETFSSLYGLGLVDMAVLLGICLNPQKPTIQNGLPHRETEHNHHQCTHRRLRPLPCCCLARENNPLPA